MAEKIKKIEELNLKVVVSQPGSVPARRTRVSSISTNLVSMEKQWNSDLKKSKICVKSLKYGSNLSKNYGFFKKKFQCYKRAFLDKKLTSLTLFW